MAELKTCPFCGGEARLRPWVAPGRSEEDPFWIVTCEDCGAMTWPYSGKAAAVMRWNRRVGKADTRGCFNCEYSREGHQTLRCFGQKGAPEVRPDDLCEAWLQAGSRE